MTITDIIGNQTVELYALREENQQLRTRLAELEAHECPKHECACQAEDVEQDT